MKTLGSRLLVALAFLLAGAAVPESTRAQLQKIQQTVFGMDCAPCAHAMERGLGSMEGVETVSVSLNEGLAALTLAKTNSIAYEDIRTTVSNGGFAAKKATLTVRGTVRHVGDRWVLDTPAGDQFVLRTGGETNATAADLQRLKPDQQVTVTGRVPASSEAKKGRWPVRVQRIQPVS